MLSGWGNYPRVAAEVCEPSSVSSLQEAVRAAETILPRGLGRSYGDSSLAGTVISLRRLNRILAFDESVGLITAEGGAPLGTILETVIPCGWFLSVTPGTKHVTLGGAIASDVHGKNHHKEGSFGDHAISMDVVKADGSVVFCSPTESPELFHAVIGGMGLVGIVVRATLRLKPIETSFVSQAIVRTKNFEETLQVFHDANDTTYSLGWVDGSAHGSALGRGVVFLGEHAPVSRLPARTAPLALFRKKALPVPPLPTFALRKATEKAFNSLYYHTHPSRESLVSYDPFFYPLDRFSRWNRVYGRRGFIEYQCVIPKHAGTRAIRLLLEAIAASGCPSFLMGIKTFGKGNQNLLSFPMEGYTLGVDFPVRERLFPLLALFDEIVMRAGGRIYLTKDARMPKAVFDAGYPRAEEFRRYKRRVDPSNKFRSLQSMRLGLY